MRVRLARLALGLLPALVAGLIACGRPETSLTPVLTPSRDPTALKEAGDAFAMVIARISGVPVKAIVASDYAGVIAIKAPEHAALLKEIYGIDGFIEASDGDYQPVRDAMALMNLSPPR